MQLLAFKARNLLPYLQGDLSLVSVIKLPEEGILTRVGGDLLATWSRYGDNRSHDVLGGQLCTRSTSTAGNRVDRRSHNQNHAASRRVVTVPHRSAKPPDVVVKHGITRS